MTTRGVLVAGGRGTRLGLDVPKALAVVGGVTLLERAVGTLARTCDEVVIAAPAPMSLQVPAADVPVRRVADRDPGGGPLAGIVAALEDEGFERAIVLAVDFPLATPEALAGLLARLETSRRAAVVPAPDGRLQPLFAAYERRAAALLAAAFDGGERSIVRAVERLEAEVLDDRALARLPGGIEGLVNLNTAADLAAIERRLTEKAARP
jgi:molybdopterin-guanine dinucleotide biosynthesis protein A